MTSDQRMEAARQLCLAAEALLAAASPEHAARFIVRAAGQLSDVHRGYLVGLLRQVHKGGPKETE